MSRYLIIVLCFSFLFSCQKEEVGNPVIMPLELMEIPAHFPEMDIPEDNRFTQSRWDLGKRLFYDPILSLDSTISCASCHKTDFAFADNLALTDGVKGRAGFTNVPTLSNIAYHPYFTREGGVPTLEMQALVPIQEHNEFDFNIVAIAKRLNQDPSYVTESQKAYNRDPDAFVIVRALSNFERSLISATSKYDQYFLNEIEYSQEEKKGEELFYSQRLGCANCHSGVHFTDYSFKNNGLYLEYENEGRFRLTKKETDRAMFKVPTLRNVSVTSPYMHDGSLPSLESVIDHYGSGGKDHLNKSSLMKEFSLSENEKEQLIAFLNTLTDHTFMNDQKFKK